MGPKKTVRPTFLARMIYDTRTTQDSVTDNPYVHFMASEMWAALASVVVYALFRSAAFATQYITDVIPLHDKTPALFLEAILSWGAAFSAGSTFIIVSAYQLIVLIRRLWERV